MSMPRLALCCTALSLFALACEEERVVPPPSGGPSSDAGTTTGDPDSGTTTTDPDAGTVTNPDAETFPDAEPPPPPGLAVLGHDTHSVDAIEWTVIGSTNLRVPRDLDFASNGELWVVNRRDDSTVTYFNVGTNQQTQLRRVDPYAMHFMEEPSSIAFGAPHATYGQMFGTCQESRNTYNNQAAPNDFMGPTLWPSAMDVYAHTNPAAEAALDFDLGSHLDMLHQSPLCMGIAWDHDNMYWTFDGASGSISRYDFQHDHEPGYDDHSDGLIVRYATGMVSRVPDVPSHLELDRVAGRLYIADTGNSRIAVLDTESGTRGRSLRGVEPGTVFYEMDGAELTTLVDGAAGELSRPSGLVLVGDILFVTDNANGRISAFDKNTGVRLDYLDTGVAAGNLMGITADAEGRLYFVDAGGNRVLRVAPKP